MKSPFYKKFIDGLFSYYFKTSYCCNLTKLQFFLYEIYEKVIANSHNSFELLDKF